MSSILYMNIYPSYKRYYNLFPLQINTSHILSNKVKSVYQCA